MNSICNGVQCAKVLKHLVPITVNSVRGESLVGGWVRCKGVWGVRKIEGVRIWTLLPIKNCHFKNIVFETSKLCVDRNFFFCRYRLWYCFFKLSMWPCHVTMSCDLVMWPCHVTILYRCVSKMDHHCPWINSCVGHINQPSFIRFLFFVPFGCIHGTIVNANFLYRLVNYVRTVCMCVSGVWGCVLCEDVWVFVRVCVISYAIKLGKFNMVWKMSQWPSVLFLIILIFNFHCFFPIISEFLLLPDAISCQYILDVVDSGWCKSGYWDHHWCGSAVSCSGTGQHSLTHSLTYPLYMCILVVEIFANTIFLLLAPKTLKFVIILALILKKPNNLIV